MGRYRQGSPDAGESPPVAQPDRRSGPAAAPVHGEKDGEDEDAVNGRCVCFGFCGRRDVPLPFLVLAMGCAHPESLSIAWAASWRRRPAGGFATRVESEESTGETPAPRKICAQ